jgi:hypothetical protein
MTRVLVVIVGILILALLFRDIVKKLISRKLLAGDKQVYKRGENPILYWSAVMLEMIIALILSCTLLLLLFLKLFLRPIP